MNEDMTVAGWASLGAALPILGIIFIAYSFLGPYMPEFLRHRGIPLDYIVNDQYLSTTGIFGVPLGVSTDFVFLFVLFGALLERAGAGKYFIDVAFSGLGWMRGGPAKAAVVASGMTGMVSGSSIANTVTTGTFTIPLMKKVGVLSMPRVPLAYSKLSITCCCKSPASTQTLNSARVTPKLSPISATSRIEGVAELHLL